MREPFDGERSTISSREDLLNSWKDIGAYFGRDVTTVQRWEKREGMPVHRHVHDKIGSVYAYRVELDAWAASRNLKGGRDITSPATSASNDVPLPEPAPPESLRRRGSSRARAIRLAALGFVLAISATLVLLRTHHSWRNPIDGVRFQPITDFDGVARDAALSRDGHLAAFLSDHDGQMDVWVTQIGSGQFHNLTHGSMAELVNPQIRTLGFSPDASLVTFWVRNRGGLNGAIGIWAVPTLGGEPRPYLEGVAEFDWSRDGSRLAYHTPGPGDPLFVSEGLRLSDAHLIFAAPPGLHSHFPVWSHDGKFIYFVQGALPDKLDIWRIAAQGGAAERITSHFAYVSHPVLLDDRTLMYLARDRDGSGPWLYGTDLASRTSHRLTAGPEHYTSLAASTDGGRVVATLSTPKTSLWQLPINDASTEMSAPVPIRLTTSAGLFPRYGPNYLLYVSSSGGSDSIWKYANGIGAELWSAPGAKVLAAPAISADGRSIAFSVRQNGQSRLYTMQADGTNVHTVADSLDLQGEPAWAHDGRSITSAVNDRGIPHLFRIPVNGGAPVSFIRDYSVDPVWLSDEGVVVYSGPDVGTSYAIKAVNLDGIPRQVPALTLTRGTRHIAFAARSHSLVLLQGTIEHKDLWCIDVRTGAKRQLTRLPADFDIQDFDLSPDGSELVLERFQERSDIVLLERR